MFSGLTNQVSTWMGKKGEEGGPMDLTGEENKPPTSLASAEELEKKDTSPTKAAASSKLEMLAGVKSQMTGWLSGGIPGLNRGAGGAEGDAAAGDPTLEQQIQDTPGESLDPVKDDDASSATGGADSGPASLEGTPTEDNGQAFGSTASTKAIAKSLGGFFYSAVNKAGKTVAEAGGKIKKTIEENKLIAELNKEQEAFIASKQTDKCEAIPPWVGAPNEDALREECLSLSSNRANFIKAPPPGVDFPFNFEAVQPVAEATLAVDPNLESMRFELVPKVVTEEEFWRNYFYRVSCLRQSNELDAMASQTESNPNKPLTSTGSIDHSQVDTTVRDNVRLTNIGSDTTPIESPAHEFVSDSLRASDTDLEEVKQGMEKLGLQPKKA